MTHNDFDKLLHWVNLDDADEICSLIYYKYKWDGREFYVITDGKKNKVGGVMLYWNDIQFQIFPQYRNKHHISNFIKTNILQNTYKLNELSIVPEAINSIDDFDKKVYLANLLQYKVKNIGDALITVLQKFDTSFCDLIETCGIFDDDFHWYDLENEIIKEFTDNIYYNDFKQKFKKVYIDDHIRQDG